MIIYSFTLQLYNLIEVNKDFLNLGCGIISRSTIWYSLERLSIQALLLDPQQTISSQVITGPLSNKVLPLLIYLGILALLATINQSLLSFLFSQWDTFIWISSYPIRHFLASLAGSSSFIWTLNIEMLEDFFFSLCSFFRWFHSAQMFQILNQNLYFSHFPSTLWISFMNFFQNMYLISLLFIMAVT